MDNFAFLLKTYERDYDAAVRLIHSFCLYNVEHIKCFVVLPEKTEGNFIRCFSDEEKADIRIVYEEQFNCLVNTDVNGINKGYINQEIIKLCFWELGLAENYFCIDSDAVFIRPFYKKDFMYDENTPYTVLFEDKDLQADPLYYNCFWQERRTYLYKIQEALDFYPEKLLTCHGFQNFSSVVLKSLKNDFMKTHGYEYRHLMEISPYEFSWYNFWLQKRRPIEIYICEPIFKTFHMKHHLLTSWIFGVKKEDLARAYVGIVINSNYLHGKLFDYDDKKQQVVQIFKFLYRLSKRVLSLLLKH